MGGTGEQDLRLSFLNGFHLGFGVNYRLHFFRQTQLYQRLEKKGNKPRMVFCFEYVWHEEYRLGWKALRAWRCTNSGWTRYILKCDISTEYKLKYDILYRVLKLITSIVQAPPEIPPILYLPNPSTAPGPDRRAHTTR